MLLSQEQIKKLEAFADWYYTNRPQADNHAAYQNDLAKKLRDIFPKPLPIFDKSFKEECEANARDRREWRQKMVIEHGWRSFI